MIKKCSECQAPFVRKPDVKLAHQTPTQRNMCYLCIWKGQHVYRALKTKIDVCRCGAGEKESVHRDYP